jgi:hypothetical protein
LQIHTSKQAGKRKRQQQAELLAGSLLGVFLDFEGDNMLLQTPGRQSERPPLVGEIIANFSG